MARVSQSSAEPYEQHRTQDKLAVMKRLELLYTVYIQSAQALVPDRVKAQNRILPVLCPAKHDWCAVFYLAVDADDNAAAFNGAAVIAAAASVQKTHRR